jgi:hypothetical protein
VVGVEVIFIQTLVEVVVQVGTETVLAVKIVVVADQQSQYSVELQVMLLPLLLVVVVLHLVQELCRDQLELIHLFQELELRP